MINILAAADEERSRRILSEYLNKENFNVITASSDFEAKELFKQKHEMLQLVILDITPTQLDDTSIINYMKDLDSTIPVMMLIAKGKKNDAILESIALSDDCMTKPLSPIILIARIKTLIKKSIEAQLYSKRDFFGLVIDETGHCVYDKNNLIDLTPREYGLLVYLAKNEGVALSREQIVNVVWGFDYQGDIRTLDAHIKNIRAKLGEKSKFIKSVRGYGYKFETT